jgi:hypothetical protein
VTAIQPENVPGNYPDGRAAIEALIQISQAEAVVKDALMRAEHMATNLKLRLAGLSGQRKDALDAIDIFADIAPASLGAFVPTQPSDEARAVEGNCTQIEADVRALLALLDKKGTE